MGLVLYISDDCTIIMTFGRCTQYSTMWVASLEVTRTKSKSSAVVKHQRIFCGFKNPIECKMVF